MTNYGENMVPRSIRIAATLLLPVICTVATQKCSARAFYVSQPRPTTHYLDAINGNDAWDGRSGQFDGRNSGPWRTLNHARSKAKEGDTVILQSGNYGLFKESTDS